MRTKNLSVALALSVVAFGIAARDTWAQTGKEEPGPGQKPKIDEHTLFLAHFNTGFDADHARGDGKPMKVANRGGAVLKPGRFGSGVEIPRGAFGIAYAGAGNFNSTQGTVEFWLKGDFEDPTEDNPRKYYLPFFVCGGTGGTGLSIARTQYNHLAVSISEAYKQTLGLCFGCSGPNKINDDQWHHVAMTWDAEHAAIFLDGRRKAWTESPAYPSITHWGGNLYIGYGSEDDYWYSQSDRKGEYIPFSAQATLDELRISDCVRYVANFPPPEREFGEGFSGKAPVAAPDIRGVTEGLGGQAESGVEWIEGPAGKAAYLHFSTVPGDYLYYRAGALANRFLGTIACRIKVPWQASDQRRHLVMDLRNRSETGYLLEKRVDGTLCFSAQQSGRAQTEVAVPAEGICDGQWHAVTAVWHTEGLRLFIDGKRRGVSDQATVVPSTLGQHLFVGSSYEAVDQLEGAITGVRIYTTCVRGE